MSKYTPISVKNVFDGFQELYRFPNGFGASVICHEFSYGGDRGLLELAVLDLNGDLCFSTPVTEDVIGHLTRTDLENVLDQIANLTPPK